MTLEETLNILKAGRNVYVTGAAGSGKTFALNQYIKYLKERGVTVAVTASTGIAATHLSGRTIHSWSGIGIKDDLSPYDIELLTQKERLYKRFEKTKVLVIDEISMLHPRMFDALDRLSRAMKRKDTPFGGMQVVLSGDFFQLPPVIKNGDVAYVDSSNAWEAGDIRVCYLKDQHRQTDETLEMILSEIRVGEISVRTQEVFSLLKGVKKKHGFTPTKLYTHNVDVDTVNEKELNKINGKEALFEMTSAGKASLVSSLCKSILAPERLRLKVGATVMFVKNNFEGGYVNGTLGVVKSFEGTSSVVKTFAGKEICVTKEKWEIIDDGKVLAKVEQLPLRLAWAITVHKSQGMTLDAAEIDLSKSFVPGQGYVALSRLRALSGLTLLGLNRMALTADPYVVELDKRLLGESSKWSKVIQRFQARDFVKMHEAFVLECGGTNDVKEIEKNRNKATEETVKKRPSHEVTYDYVTKGTSIKDIAKERGMTTGTIISHLEKLKNGEKSGLALTKYKPKAADLKKIKEAFNKSKDMKLAPAYRKLKGEYTYEELRLARLFV